MSENAFIAALGPVLGGSLYAVFHPPCFISRRFVQEHKLVLLLRSSTSPRGMGLPMMKKGFPESQSLSFTQETNITLLRAPSTATVLARELLHVHLPLIIITLSSFFFELI